MVELLEYYLTQELQLFSYLVVLSMSNYDVIIGMDWWSSSKSLVGLIRQDYHFQLLGRGSILVDTSKGNPFAESFLVHIESEEVMVELPHVPILSKF